MLYRYGHLPVAPVLGDEVIINEPAIALSRGQGLVAPSFQDSAFGLDKLYAHFPPVYIFAESLAFRKFGVSVYSLRLVTTAMGIAAAGIFLVLMWGLCRWGLADWGTASIAACLYTLNASTLIMHRIARMESTVECLLLSSLLCVLAGIFSCDGDAGSRIQRRRLLFLLGGAVLAGASLATHPEALSSVLPIALLLLLAAPVRWMARVVSLAVLVITPIAIWLATYGARWKQALAQMDAIHRSAPPPGIFGFGRDFLLEKSRNLGQGSRATLFALCLLILGLLVVRWIALRRGASHRPERAEETSSQLLLTGIFASSTIISLSLLMWTISASVTRYEVIFPVYLAGLVIALRGISPQKPLVRWGLVFTVVFILFQIGAMSVYLNKDSNTEVDLEATRFDAVVDSIPQSSRVAVTPMLWLAFQHKGRPITLLYNDFDGKEKWLGANKNPLVQFDAVVLDPSFVDEFSFYDPYAAQGRKKQTVSIGSDLVNLYQR
jgi:hypothetical protein